MDNVISNTASKKPFIHPKKFALWLFMVSIGMIFVSLTSAYIVRRADGNWLEFELPTLFVYSTIVIVVSSITVQYALVFAKRGNISQMTTMLGLTILLAITFFSMKYYACFVDLFNRKIYFGGEESNAAGSFVYTLTIFVHGFHIITGLVFLMIVFFRGILGYIKKENILSVELCSTYWHFLGILWIYLYIFLILNH